MGPIHVIANPKAARGKGGRILPKLERRLEQAGLEYRLCRTRASGHARELAREARGLEASSLLVVGGDGTVHEVVDGLLSGRAEDAPSSELPPLAILPMGTGNDFFRMVRAPGGVDGVMRVLIEGVPREFEVGRARWEGGEAHFVNLVGVGIDVEVLKHRASFSVLPGVLQYLGALAVALRSYRPVPMRVELRGRNGEHLEIEGSVLLSAVTVGPSVGGGFVLSPGARPDDGLLDLFVVEELGVLKVARYLPSVLRGTLSKKPEIHQEQVTHVRMRRRDGGSLRFELDGELMPEETTVLDLSVLPGVLRFLELPEERSR